MPLLSRVGRDGPPRGRLNGVFPCRYPHEEGTGRHVGLWGGLGASQNRLLACRRLKRLNKRLGLGGPVGVKGLGPDPQGRLPDRKARIYGPQLAAVDVGGPHLGPDEQHLTQDMPESAHFRPPNKAARSR